MDITVQPSEVEGDIVPPCSKSYAQRTFAAALLSTGTTRITNLQMCDDTISALRSITHLGAKVLHTSETSVEITGGLNPVSEVLNIGESGLGARLFTPIAALCNEPISIIGVKSIIGRPMGMMIAPLRNLGVEVKSDGFLPITVTGPLKGGQTDVDGYVSSQFLSGLLMALPVAKGDSILHVDKLQSEPYIKMTVDTAERFGIKIEHNQWREFFIRGGQSYTAIDTAIEGDWSSAAFMLTAGAVAGHVRVSNMNMLSLQADLEIVDILSRAGAEIVSEDNEISVTRRQLNAFEADIAHCPDLFPVLVVLASASEGTSIIHGVERLIHKESNRAEAILEEYASIGIKVSLADQNTMRVEGGPIRGGTISSRGDHRIAMAAAIAGLISEEGVTITDADTVSKSYPDFWQALSSITPNAIYEHDRS